MSRSWPLDGSANNCKVENGGRKCFKKVSTRHWKLLLNIDQKSDTWKISCAPKLKILWKKQNLGILVRVKKERSWSDSLGALEIIIQTSPHHNHQQLQDLLPKGFIRHILSFLVLWEHLLWIHRIRRHGDNNDFALGSMAGLKKLIIMMESLPLGDFELSKEKSNY